MNMKIGADPQDRRTVGIRAERHVVGGEAAGGERRHGVVDRVEAVHAGGRVEQGAGENQTAVDADQGQCEGLEAFERLVLDVGGLDLEVGDAADVEERQQEQTDRDDAEAAEIVEQRPPEQKPRGKIVEAADHGRSRRRDARHRFEDRVGEAHLQRRCHERHGAGDCQRQPQHVDEQKAEAGRCLRRPALRGERHRHREAAEEEGREGEDLPVGVARSEVDHRGNEHGEREIEGEDRGDVDRRAKSASVHGSTVCDRPPAPPGQRTRQYPTPGGVIARICGAA